jgi:hypothetical protein
LSLIFHAMASHVRNLGSFLSRTIYLEETRRRSGR